MLSSIFIILQVYLLPTTAPELNETIILTIISSIVCGIILYLVSNKNFLKHLFSGMIIVSILSFVIGAVLSEKINMILTSISISLPAATIVDALKD